MQREGVFRGTPTDIAHGYIHMSSGVQLATTLEKHFNGIEHLVLAAVDLARLGDSVRWEQSRNGQLFPHIHGILMMDAVLAVAPLERAPDGTVKLPA